MGNKISKYSEKSRLASVKSWLHFLFPEILQPQYFTRAKRFVSKFLETAFEYFLCCRECRGFKCLRARGRRHVLLFCPRVCLSGSQLISVSLQNSPIVCVCDPWHWFCLTPHASLTTNTNRYNRRFEDSDTFQWSRVRQYSHYSQQLLSTHHQDKLFRIQSFLFVYLFSFYETWN